MVPRRDVQRTQRMVSHRKKADRFDVRTCLLGTVCNDAVVQPHLPQVVLPAYSKRVRPPATALQAYQRTRAPLEYWHGTNGWTSTAIIIRWLTRLRAIVSSVKPGAWIVLSWDCASVHLNPAVLGHMRRLHMLVLFVPSGLTHIFQVLDVFIYADFKRRLRLHFLRRASAAHGGHLDRDHRIHGVGRAIHESLVQVSCTDFFRKVGLLGDFGAVTEDIFALIGDDPIGPALPCRAEFATLTGSTPHTPPPRRCTGLPCRGGCIFAICPWPRIRALRRTWCCLSERQLAPETTVCHKTASLASRTCVCKFSGADTTTPSPIFQSLTWR